MSKRSFMRGFGIGVLFATIILGISGLLRTSDAAVVKRAKQLGMDYVSEEEPLFPNSRSASSGAADVTRKSSTPKPLASKKPSGKKTKKTPKPEKVVSQQEIDQKDLDQEKEKIKEDYKKAVQEFTIQEGEWSDAVSKKLEKMGIVSDAKKFDDYLEKHGYSDDIVAGNFQVSADATFEEIAKEITR